MSAIIIPGATPLVQLSIDLAVSKVGVHETTDNWGPEVKAFLAAAKIHEPAPWCAAFVNWCAENAAKQLGVVSPLEAVPIQGYVQSYYLYGKKNGWIVPASEARGGDLFLVWFPSLERYAHIGFVTRVWHDQGIFTCIEGNSNSGGSREGVEVVRRRSDRPRRITPNIVFLRWSR